MSRIASSFTVLLTATLLGTPLAASAQEAIMLETIGAVRMAAPDELQRTNATHDRPTDDRRVTVRAASAETTAADR